MPPSRRNLIIIGCLCIVTIYLAASVRIYQSMTRSGNSDALRFAFIPYAPYTIPGPDKGIYNPFWQSKVPQESPVPAATKVAVKQVPVQHTGPLVPVTAQAYMVGDVESGKVYLEKNAKTVLPVASMSKLITAFVATETLDPDALISISEDNAKLPPDTSNLVAGERMELKTLLYPLLLSSSNVAAEAIASAINRGDFLESMSSYAWEVGMPSSFFADASGINPQNAAPAREMFALAKYLYKSRQDILAITRTSQSAVGTTSDHGAHVFTSTHPFITDPNFLGGKTGRTPEAGETMITLMKINNRPLAFIVLGSRYGNREADTRMLIEAVKKMF